MNLSNRYKKIALFGVPRSGTSWLGQIINSSPKVIYRYQPIFSFEFKDRLNQASTKADIKKFHEDLLSAGSDFVLQTTTINGQAGPAFNKNDADTLVWKEVRYHNIIENLLRKDLELKVVGIVRNPKSVLNSWYHAPKEFSQEWDILDEWEFASNKNKNKPEEFNGYEKWKEVANLYTRLRQEYPDRFYLLEYSSLLNDTVGEVKRLFDFCGIEYEKQTEDFISESQNTDASADAYSVYRKNQTDDKWKKGLPTSIAQAIDEDLRESDLERFNRQ